VLLSFSLSVRLQTEQRWRRPRQNATDTHAVNGWRKTGQSIGMSEEELEPFTDAFEHGERAAAKRLI
jgi:hypothetical protein